VTELGTIPAPGAQTRDVQQDRAGEGFRPDVEGLRTVAIGTVLLYHAGISLVPGGFVGVDVFFVISGFLITGLLLRELSAKGTISLTRFYARRAKRLLPATGVVLTATVLLTLAFLPRVSWRSISGDVMAAATYVVNWRLAAGSVNYLNEDQAVSPVQQFWSLAVEEQYYLVWPLLLLLAALWFRHRSGGRVTNGPLWVGLAVIAVPSFAWSLHLTSTNPSVAFFVTTTRMWELAVGAAVAIGAAQLRRLPTRVAVLLGWGGLAAIAAAALLVSASDAWPGYLALVPTLGTAAVIAAGPAAGPAGPVALLGTRPFVWVGGLSYSLYLWHWPIIIAATAHWGGTLTGVQGLLMIALSFVPAYLSLRLVENPFRYARALSRLPRAALAVGAAFTVLGVVAGLGLRSAVPELGVDPGSKQAASARGADALGRAPAKSDAGKPVDSVDWMTPDALKAAEDVPVAYADKCQQTFESSVAKRCVYGDKNADTTVAIVGDSKALQWLPALQELAGREHWKILTYTKSGCPFTDARVANGREEYTTCTEWNHGVLSALKADPPDVVLTSSNKKGALVPGSTRKSTVTAMSDGLARAWKAVTDAGTPVIVVRDNPSPTLNVDKCVAENLKHLTACTFSRANGVRLSGSAPQVLALEQFPQAISLDLTDAICPQQRCAPVIGHVLVYRQGSHLTATYARSLADRLRPAIVAALSRKGQ
jgi:peptidoglycan/LPS O-acetylase OafA/YrhL